MSIEPGETLLEFPCEFPIKAFVTSEIDGPGIVLAIVSRHVAEIPPHRLTTRASKGGRYLAVTVTIEATSKAQLDAIYLDLTHCPDVIMAL